VKVVTSHPIIDAVIDQHGVALGKQLPIYRNHVYRGLNYHQILLGGPASDAAALAWAVHDLGVWTAHTLDYLAPSADLAEAHAPEFGITAVGEVRTLVMEHHKLRPTGDRMIDSFRRADLADASRGRLAGGIDRERVRAVVDALPYLGFHTFLAVALARHAVRHPTRPFPMLRW
jgi:hypothetical protein